MGEFKHIVRSLEDFGMSNLSWWIGAIEGTNWSNETNAENGSSTCVGECGICLWKVKSGKQKNK